jgi:bifunctional DNA-binding transcriptional regulator/antitoxin component of YhaV-PrlF toxin-antitoxin module
MRWLTRSGICTVLCLKNACEDYNSTHFQNSTQEQTVPDRTSTVKVVRALRSGQITIPIEFRKALAIDDDTLLQVTLVDGELRMRPIEVKEPAGSRWLRELYEFFAPVREEAIERGLTEDEINDAIDQAVEAVRTKHASRRF